MLYSFHLDNRQNAVEDKVVVGFDRQGDHDSEKEMAEKEKEQEKQEEKEEKQVSCARGRFVPPDMACLMLAPLTASPSRNGTEEGPEHD